MRSLTMVLALTLSIALFTSCKKSVKDVCIEGCNQAFKTGIGNCVTVYAQCLLEAGDDKGAQDECKKMLKTCIEFQNGLRAACVEVCNGL